MKKFGTPVGAGSGSENTNENAGLLGPGAPLPGGGGAAGLVVGLCGLDLCLGLAFGFGLAFDLCLGLGLAFDLCLALGFDLG
jgi:hypothetical protein